MLYAITSDRTRATASPGAAGLCPTCSDALVAKCGPIVTHHWAHYARSDCDPWSEPESEWHLTWKRRFADVGADVEVTMRRGDAWHRADVQLGGWTIELQRSTIPVEEACTREAFYGQMVWLFDMTGPRWDRVHFGRRGFWWKHGAKSLAYLRRPIWWDTPEGPMQVSLGLVNRGVCQICMTLDVPHECIRSQRLLGRVLRQRTRADFLALRW